MSDAAIAIIPARGGSKGVPDKNIKLLNGKPLLAYSIAVAKLAGIERVLVSTDSRQYAEIASNYGAEVPFLRPIELSTDTSTDFEFMRHAMEWMQIEEGEVAEYWIHLRPTTPLRDPIVIQSALDCIKKLPEADSLRSAHEASESPFKWFLRDENGYFKGLREDLSPKKVNLPRQIFPNMYIPDGYVDIVRGSYVLNHEDLHGTKMYVFVTPICMEIDTIKDLEFIDFQINKNPSPLTKYLQQFS